MINTGVIVSDGYLGCNALTGVNYTGYRRYGEINKIVKKAFLEKFPKTKVSCRGSSFSGGQSCDAVLFFPLDEIVNDYDTFRKLVNDTNYYIESYWLGNRRTIDIPIEERYKIIYNDYVNRLKHGVSVNYVRHLDKCILKPETIEKVRYLNALYDSFNYRENNSMVDYFDNMFYKSVDIQII